MFYVRYHAIEVCVVILMILLIQLTIISPALRYDQVFAHVGEVSNLNVMSGGGGTEVKDENESLILSGFMAGDINLSTNSTTEQWRESFDYHVKSLWGHDISVRTVNNGTHIFFLLSWNDPTTVNITKKGVEESVRQQTMAGETDGLAIIFERLVERPLKQEQPNLRVEAEPGQEIKDSWYWSTKSPTGAGITIKAEEYNGNWNVVMGREIQSKSENVSSISFQPGVREEGFVKFVVWDGSKGESLEQINDETLPHYDFMLLPEINIYPKDVYIWSTVLVAGAVLFLFVEQRLYKVHNMKVRKR